LNPPAGFVRLVRGRREAWVREGYLFYIEGKGLLDPSPYFAELSHLNRMRGRGSLLLIEGEIALVVRKYRHGGILRALNEDLFLLGARPFQELLITEWLRAEGVNTLEVVAAIKEGVGMGLYRGYLLTRFLPQAVDMISFLRDKRGGRERREVIRKAGALTRRVHDLGLFHPDLHLKNFLVREGEVYLIDFDRAKRYPQLPPSLRMRGIKRLDRSAEKLKRKGLPLSLTDKAAFWSAYSQGEMREWIRGYSRRYPLYRGIYRMGWALEGLLYPSLRHQNSSVILR